MVKTEDLRSFAVFQLRLSEIIPTGTGMMIKAKRDNIKPLLVNFGVAFAFSFAGILYSRYRAKRKKSSISSDHGNKVDARGRALHKDEYHAPRISTTSCNVVSDRYEEMHAQKLMVENSTAGRSSNDRENDLEKEFDFVNAGFSANVKDEEKDRLEQEIMRLKNKPTILKDRERNLEIQLLEYYGLKEQEATVKELQNRLKINNIEAKLFSLKIESLETDNKRLAAQVAEHAQISAELDVAKSKIKLLKKKLWSEAEYSKEQIIAFQKRVAKLQEDAASDAESQIKSLKLNDLEGEAEELRESNTRLQIENSELSRRLESTQILANSILEDPETEVLKQMGDRLKRDNEGLKKEIKQLQTDRCADVEELVYLRWINACLRYELRQHQTPIAGKTLARDLSKTLSTESEEKAKRLILEYANPDGTGTGTGTGERGISVMDFDSDTWTSSSRNSSSIMDLENFDDSSTFDNLSATKSTRKVKLFNKLRKLIRGKDNHNNHISSGDHKNISESSRCSFSDVGSSSGNKRSRWSSGETDNSSMPRNQLDYEADLMKFAGALMDSRRGTEKPPK